VLISSLRFWFGSSELAYLFSVSALNVLSFFSLQQKKEGFNVLALVVVYPAWILITFDYHHASSVVLIKANPSYHPMLSLEIQLASCTVPDFTERGCARTSSVEKLEICSMFSSSEPRAIGR
jgi:hypothetical protein